jgi:hypothetical protein
MRVPIEGRLLTEATPVEENARVSMSFPLKETIGSTLPDDKQIEHVKWGFGHRFGHAPLPPGRFAADLPRKRGR